MLACLLQVKEMSEVIIATPPVPGLWKTEALLKNGQENGTSAPPRKIL